jgi:3-phenylpropionate/trans-cinnamate dioxygenase ferredoxin reductase subunit
MQRTFVIVGAGQAGAWVARTLRSEGFEGRIVLIGSERHLPYERPPLSKDILSGKAAFESAALLANASELAIEHWSAVTALAVEPKSKSVTCDNSLTVRYDHLFLTTGAAVRTIRCTADTVAPGRVHVLRTADDALRLRNALLASRSLAVIGGGWIGLEVAATARAMGLDVFVFEAGPRLCARSVPPPVSDFLRELHERNAVKVRTGVLIRDVTSADEQLVVGSDAGAYRVDQVLIGIGINPATRLAERAGLSVDNGIVVDAGGRTSDPSISAAGDVTSQPCGLGGTRVRLESWLNAQNQAIVAAKVALNQDIRHIQVPWAWSDQYNANIQIVGTPERAEQSLLRGRPRDGAGCWLAVDGHNNAIGAVAVNAVKEIRAVRKALESKSTLDLAQWQDAQLPANRIRIQPLLPMRTTPI